MNVKDILSIILSVVAIIGFIIFLSSSQNADKLPTAFWSCLITSISTSVVIAWNPWLIGK